MSSFAALLGVNMKITFENIFDHLAYYANSWLQPVQRTEFVHSWHSNLNLYVLGSSQEPPKKI